MNYYKNVDQEILNLKTDLFKKYKTKLVRHKDGRVEYRDLIKDRVELLEYQKEQSKPLFHDCDYIITRDKKGFKSSKITVMTPEEFLVYFEKNQI